jgi:ubiquinone/menaquinone biosynthesis C-methylase UbiE
MIDPTVQRLLTPMLGSSLVLWSELFFKPYQASKRQRAPIYLDRTPDNYDTVEQFDFWSAEYDFIRPFVQPILDATYRLMRPYLTPSSRVLDPSCGPGDNVLALAEELPDGEVVAADLSRGMVAHAHRRAVERGHDHMAFVQADVVEPPDVFHGYFDAVLCCLAFHHYHDAPAAARALRRVLAPGGTLFIADGDPSWNEPFVTFFSKLADPGFVEHRTGPQFLALLRDAGFREVFWTRALPGIGVTIAR